jgi:hypothetical protein
MRHRTCRALRNVAPALAGIMLVSCTGEIRSGGEPPVNGVSPVASGGATSGDLHGGSTSAPPASGGSPANGLSPSGSGGATSGALSGGSTSTPPVVDAETKPFSPAAGSFKRLTASELKNSLTVLLGAVTVGDLEPDTFVRGFAKVGGSTVSVSPSGVEKYISVIEAATAEVFADATRRSALVGCTPTGVSDTACFRSFVARFGRLAWRRALTEQQLDRQTTLAASLAQIYGNATDALRATTNALLLSPHFLYRLERGEPDSSSTFWHYTGHEMASRLSYFLTNNAPDEPLLAAAEQGQLGSVDGVRAEAQRLLETNTGRESVRNFSAELFRVAQVASKPKDATLYPSYTPALQQALMREVPSMFEDLVFDQRMPATDIFTTRTTFVNADSARLYGLDASRMVSDSRVKVTLPLDGVRAGLLGTGAFLAQFADQKEGSPTNRGRFVRTVLMCQTIPDPPPNVATVLEDPADGTVLTKREKLAQHREQGGTCSGCHSLMDPLGLPFENFDAIGAYRATDRGKTIDVTGSLDGTDFNGPIELGQLLSKNPAVAACLVRGLYRYATGVVESDGQESTIARLVTQFEVDGRDMKKLMVDLVGTDGFRLVTPAP